MGNLAHPTPTVIFFVSGGVSIQKLENDSPLTILGEWEEKSTRHYVASDNVSRTI